jgi:signal transduction histidine kinase
MASIVQEALSNVLQHAQATQVKVCLEHEGKPGAWRLEVCDNGRGLPEPSAALRTQPSGFGLEGMRSRALQMGGVLELIRPEEGGTCIHLVLPDDGASQSAREGLHGAQPGSDGSGVAR